MPCARHLIGNPGGTFDFRIVNDNNLFTSVGRLRITGPQTGTSVNFLDNELRQGIQIPLAADMSYTLRIVVQPAAPGVVSMMTQTSVGVEACSRDGAGEIGIWSIDVL